MDTALPEEIIDWLLLQNKKAKDNLVIKSGQEVGSLYHIDKNKPTKFFPQMPRSAAASEDNTIARVTVAETLIGCLMGYARIERDFHYRKEYSKGKDPFKGGYVISEIDYQYCGIPNTKLVYDAELTGEKWLFTYSKETLQFIPREIGKVFVTKLEYIGNSDYPTLNVTCYVDIQKETGMLLTSDLKLAHGYWKIQFSEFGKHAFNTSKNLVVKKVSASEYEDAKKLNAALLSNAPIFVNW